MKWKFLFFLISYVSNAAFAAELRHYYVIKSGECITEALYVAGLEPMYGKSGFLIDIQNENPGVRSLDLVRPGQRIYFPKRLALRAEGLGYVQITSTNEILLSNSKSMAAIVGVNRPLQIPEKRQPAQEEKIVRTGPAASLVPMIDIQSRIDVSFGTGYSRIDSKFIENASSAKILSKPSMSADLKWEHIWSDSLESIIHWSYESIFYKDANQGVLLNDRPSKSLVGLGLKNKLTENLWLVSEVGSREEIFAPSYAAGTSILEASSLVFVKLGLQKDLLQVRALKMTGGLAGTYLLGESGGSYDIKAGTAVSGFLKFSQKLKAYTLFAEAEYLQTLQNTSQAQQNTRDLKTRLGVSIPLGSAGVP